MARINPYRVFFPGFIRDAADILYKRRMQVSDLVNLVEHGLEIGYDEAVQLTGKKNLRTDRFFFRIDDRGMGTIVLELREDATGHALVAFHLYQH